MYNNVDGNNDNNNDDDDPNATVQLGKSQLQANVSYCHKSPGLITESHF